MNSTVARRMDSDRFLDESDSTESLYAELEEQYGPSAYGTIRYDAEVLYWMGYLYRYWAYTREKSSASIWGSSLPFIRLTPIRPLSVCWRPGGSTMRKAI